MRGNRFREMGALRRGPRSKKALPLAAVALLTLSLVLAGGPALGQPAAADTPEAVAKKLEQDKIRELVRKADRILRGRTSASVLEMRIKTADYDRKYSMVLWDDARGRPKTLVKILGPALWRGNGTLKDGDRLLTYNPRNDHITVVGSSMLGDSWMGSHFSNDDLVKETQLDRDYDPSIAKEWDADGPDGEGQAHFYRIRLAPLPRAPVVWGAIEIDVYERGERALPVQMTYFKEDTPDAKPARTMTFHDVKDLGGRVVPARMHMTVANKPGEFTEITYKKIRFDIDIPADKFTDRALRQ